MFSDESVTSAKTVNKSPDGDDDVDVGEEENEVDKKSLLEDTHGLCYISDGADICKSSGTDQDESSNAATTPIRRIWISTAASRLEQVLKTKSSIPIEHRLAKLKALQTYAVATLLHRWIIPGTRNQIRSSSEVNKFWKQVLECVCCKKNSDTTIPLFDQFTKRTPAPHPPRGKCVGAGVWVCVCVLHLSDVVCFPHFGSCWVLDHKIFLYSDSDLPPAR